MKKPYGYWQQSAHYLAKLHDQSDAQSNGYIHVKRDGKNVLLHIWIWKQLVGAIPEGYEIDHINGIRWDCRLSNLRCVPKLINLRNSAKQSNNTSGFTGVNLIVDRGREYWAAVWSDPVTGKSRFKRFSVNKYGDNAKQMAIAYRAYIQEGLIKNHGYSTRHGI